MTDPCGMPQVKRVEEGKLYRETENALPERYECNNLRANEGL